MRLALLIGTCALLGVSAAAQTPARPAVAAQEPPRPLTLTGCVQAWDPSTMGPPPSPGEGGQVLILTDAQDAAKATPGAPSPSSTPASPDAKRAPAAGGHSTYLLKAASAAVNLASHLDHRVELTGTLATDHAAATPAAPTTPPGASAAGTPGDRPAAASAPPVAFTVTRVTMLEKSCPK
jgi:hypothetical protein